MSKSVNSFEVHVDVSFAEYLMSAKDAATIQSIFANAVRIKRNYDSNTSAYEYKLHTDQGHTIITRSLDRASQADIALQISST